MTSAQNHADIDNSDAPPPTIDLRAIIADFRRFSRIFIAVFFSAFLLIFLPSVLRVPEYTATSSVMLDPRTETTVANQDVLSNLPADTTSVDTEVEVLQSTSLADRVTESLKLDQDPEFNSALKPKGLFGLVKQSLFPSHAQPVVPAQALHEAVSESVLHKLSVKRLGLTRIITISVTTKSPQKSAKIANEWARLYLSQQLEAKFNATKEANNWLSSRLDDLKSQVETAETAVQQYKIANNLMNTTGDNTIGQQEITTLDQQLASVKVDKAEAEARLGVARSQLASSSNGEDVGAALDSPVIKDLRAKRAVVSQSMADLQSRYGPLHPDIVKSKRELEDIDAQINAEIKRIMSNLEAQSEVQREREASLENSVGQARGRLAGNNQATVKLDELQRNADAVSTLYQSYLDRFKQTSTQQGIDKTDAKIVSDATTPGGPSSPNVPLSLAFSFLIAFVLAAVSVFVRRGFDNGLMTGSDVERHLAHPYLGSISQLQSTVSKSVKTNPMKYIVDKPLSIFAECFRNLRAGLIYSRVGEEVKVIAVTSSFPGEGKTTTAVCLARSMAMSGQSVVLVDCDLRRRSVNQLLKKEISQGLLEVLAGDVDFNDVLITDELTTTQFLPLAEGTHTPKDVFGSPAMDKLIASLREKFDIVIFDTAPVLAVADTRIICRKADVVAMLVRWRKTPRKAVANSLEVLESVGAHIGGVALTQVNIKEQTKFGYGDSGFYYKQYKNYYIQ